MGRKRQTMFALAAKSLGMLGLISIAGMAFLLPQAGHIDKGVFRVENALAECNSEDCLYRHVFPTSLGISIAAGESCTSLRNVDLAVRGRGISQVILSNDNQFADSEWQVIEEGENVIPWVLSNEEGVSVVYAIFKSETEDKSLIQFDTILYKPSGCTVSQNTDQGYVYLSGGVSAVGEETSSANTLLADKKQRDCSFFDYTFRTNMAKGDIGGEVLILQEFLQCLGYLPDDFAPTAEYETETFNAVQLFQKEYDLDALGKVGPTTRDVLNTLSHK